ASRYCRSGLCRERQPVYSQRRRWLRRADVGAVYHGLVAGRQETRWTKGKKKRQAIFFVSPVPFLFPMRKFDERSCSAPKSHHFLFSLPSSCRSLSTCCSGEGEALPRLGLLGQARPELWRPRGAIVSDWSCASGARR